ncbi:MAG TPA: DASS family sodium-coupled anion symporter [Fimbriimonadaceae bacterium]|nr:DASS family sodium-coupled anion symporter [Fimbriimonadaceae bacterium]
MKALKILGPLVAALAVWFLLGDYTLDQRKVGAIFALTVGLWISEAFPIAVTALLSSSLLIIAGTGKEKEVFAAYGEPTVPLFIGSFILAKAMEASRLSDRFAWLILSKGWAHRSPSSLLFSLGAIACIVSLFVSNTATTAMMLPIGLAMLAALGAGQGSRYAMGSMLMLTWGSSIAVGVPVGTPPNLIGMRLIEDATGKRITFLEWMAFGMPITIAMLGACWFVLWIMYRRDAPKTREAGLTAKDAMRDLGPFTHAQRNTLLAFVIAMILWIGPDLLAALLGPDNALGKSLQSALPPSVAAIVAAATLFLFPCHDGSTRFSWSEARTIDWGTILLFAGGIALGQAMFSSGLAKELGQVAAEASGAQSLWSITLLCTVAGVALSELASNTAAATTLVPVAIGLAQGAGVSPIAPALGVAVGASLGFMLPVSTAPNAIVYSSGLIPSRQMMKAGLVIDIIGIVVTVGGLYLVLPLLGLV